MTRVNRLFILIILIFAIGCGSGKSETTSPITTGNNAPVSTINPTHWNWGTFDVEIDRLTGGILVDLRRTAQFNANVTGFLQPPLVKGHLLTVALNDTSDLLTGYVDCDITITHPFPDFPVYRGFDVRGILLTNGTYNIESYNNLKMAGPDESRLLNTDGYTRWWNALEFGPPETVFGYTKGEFSSEGIPSATLNPYKYFADGLSKSAEVSSLNVAGRGTFSVKSSNTRNYKIQFPVIDDVPILEFWYSVDASWSPPDPAFEPDYPIEAFPDNANCREPFHLKVEDAGSTLWFENAGSWGGELSVAIEYFDWGLPDEIDYLSVELQSPAFSVPVSITNPAFTGGSNEKNIIIHAGASPVELVQSGVFEIVAVVECNYGYEPFGTDPVPGQEWPGDPVTVAAVGSITVDSQPPPVNDVWSQEHYDSSGSRFNDISNIEPPLTLSYSKNLFPLCFGNPIISGDMIYAIDPNGSVHCFNAADGEEVWSEPVMASPTLFLTTTPGIANDMVIAVGDGILAFDAQTGALQWQRMNTIPHYKDGLVIASNQVYSRSGSGYLLRVNLLDPDDNDTVGWLANPEFSPVYGEVSGGTHGYLVCPAGSSFRCINASDLSLLWIENTIFNPTTNAITVGDYAYVGYNILVKKHLETGAEPASYDLGTSNILGFCRDDSSLFVLTQDPGVYKGLYSFDFDLNYQWNISLGFSNNMPTCANGYIWVANGPTSATQSLHAYSTSDGSLAWSDTTYMDITSPGVSAANGRLYVIDTNGNLYVYQHDPG
jgi:outer membrane protein assembly factor BamB